MAAPERTGHGGILAGLRRRCRRVPLGAFTNAPPHPSGIRSLKAEAALVANTIVWGATFVLVKSSLADVSPVLFLALRFCLATAALVAIFGRGIWGHAGARTGISRPELRAGVMVGLLLFAGYLFQTVGLQYTSAPKSAFLTATSSVMVPLLVRLVYKSRPRRSELLGLLAATAGMGLMTLEGPLGSVNRGDLLTLCCAAAFAGHIVTLGHFSKRMSFEVLSVIQVGTAALLAGSLFWWGESARVLWRPQVVVAILATGLLATAVAFTVQAWAQQYTTSTRTALIYLLEPVFAWLTSYLLVGEGLSVRAAVGAALILGGVLVVEAKPLQPRLHPSN
jgi:drug/metabolite transporter (DMT)-like permease